MTLDLHFEVSRRVREAFASSRDYYALPGPRFSVPVEATQQPDQNPPIWYGENCFRG